MKPERAIIELNTLKQKAVNDPQVRLESPAHREWKAKVTAVLERSLGTDSSTVQQFTRLSYTVGVWTGAPGENERDRRYFAERVDDAIALIDAAIYELELSVGAPAVEGGSYDAGLWDHVKHSVEEGRWEQVASAGVIYVEDKVRRCWARHWISKARSWWARRYLLKHCRLAGHWPSVVKVTRRMAGGASVQAWLLLSATSTGTGIQERPDAKQYALGVLGLASLLLTQIKFEHGDAVQASR